jgi:hypothetical protein
VRRLLIASLCFFLLLCIVLLTMGGLNYRSEVEYVDPSRSLVELPSINVQNVRLAEWDAVLARSSTYGPPFDLYIAGTLPDSASASSVELTDLVIEAPSQHLLSIPTDRAPVQDTLTISGGVKRRTKGFLFSHLAYSADTPAQITVAGKSTILFSEGSETREFRKLFYLNRVRRVSLGTYAWNF